MRFSSDDFSAWLSDTLGLARTLIQTHPRALLAAIGALTLGTTGAAWGIASLGPDSASLPVRQILESVQPLAMRAHPDDLDTSPIQLYRTELTRSSDTVDSLLARLGVSDATAAGYLRRDATLQRMVMGRAGRSVTVETNERRSLLKLTVRWASEEEGYFKRLEVSQTGNGFATKLENAQLKPAVRMAGGTVRSSLFAATDDSGIPDAVAIQLAEIFSGDIDFHRALRKGDRFSVVYESLEADGEPLRTGRLLSAEFDNAGHLYQAMWFQEPGLGANGQPSKGGYYTLGGQSLRRVFLASPLEFSRVTSGFKMRLHPIMNTWRAHLGVDYGAATGTPVRTVGEGTVDFAGAQSGFGNVVIVKHNGANSTVYAHLSRISVHKGQRVAQGQTIGAVGATGWATGPHLHFEFRVNGQHRDPLTLARQSDSVPVSAAARPLFTQQAVSVRRQLTAAASMLHASAE